LTGNRRNSLQPDIMLLDGLLFHLAAFSNRGSVTEQANRLYQATAPLDER
jgi:hypothetical protein